MKIKSFLSILSVAFTAFALDLQEDTLHRHSHPIITTLYTMDENQLQQFSASIRHNFEVLTQEKLISFPFTVRQAPILRYHFASDSSEIEKFQLVLQGSDITFPQILGLYEALSAIHDITNTNYLSDILSYINLAPNVIGSDLPPLCPDNLTRIYYHFTQVQNIVANLPQITTWNWLHVRYHLDKTAQYLGLSLSRHTESFYEEHPFWAVFGGSRIAKKTFLKNIKKITSALRESIGLPEIPIKDPSSSDKSELQTYSKHLKVLLAELPYITLLSHLQKYPDFDKVISFWKLYQLLTINYGTSRDFPNKSAVFPYDPIKVCALVNALDSNPLAKNCYTVQDTEKLLESKKGKMVINELVTTFANPFAPKLYEVLAFEYYMEELNALMKEAGYQNLKTFEAHSPKKGIFGILNFF